MFTNGVFDILHRGHVTYLTEARKLGASLIVAINSDASARRLNKGPGRPINNAADRAFVLSALSCVSAVIEFDQDTPCELIETLRPDVYVKGGDYDMDALKESQLVRSWGGAAIALPFVVGQSTSAIVARIMDYRGLSATE